jgi:hypothetical protein
MSVTTRAGVHPQITDSVTQASCHVLGLGPAVAAVGNYIALGVAQSMLFANMANQQQQQALISMTATSRSIGRLLKLHKDGSSKPSLDAPAGYGDGDKDGEPPDYMQPPVVT